MRFERFRTLAHEHPAIPVYGKVLADLSEGLELAAESIDSGRAMKVLRKLVAFA